MKESDTYLSTIIFFIIDLIKTYKYSLSKKLTTNNYMAPGSQGLFNKPYPEPNKSNSSQTHTYFFIRSQEKKLEPEPGFEPRTSGFLARRSATCAILFLYYPF